MLRIVVVSGEQSIIDTYLHYADGTKHPLTVQRIAQARRNHKVQLAFQYYSEDEPSPSPEVARQVLDQMECAYCFEETDRLLEPPIVRIPQSALPGFEEGDVTVDWHAPGQAFPGTDSYDVLSSDEFAVYVRPWECPDKPLCMRCWAGQVIPALGPYLHNKPPQLKLNGHRAPEWIGP